ncbi:BTAD domain-containing putative transcriptional regulator [Streptomyces sp. SL13]|uniref:BTAD domain-containing putative transcriptional regulator n=1 Tax=Streptantibioticus silvisoli TaxID=2705255 RepID=A0AA90H655_9ACTN|nr:BTAD domain-containing putative transcriptional regulator [Streptantibioticus silvisoli]MDI5971329.1 BTAD domain-containing putative transcriptional regulator [Streptantibioticus silvisoli]
MRYGILGTTEVAGRPAPGGARLRALLAALAARPGRPVPADLLAEAVWGTDPPADTPGALQALVSRLRRAIGRQEITSGPAGYVLRADPDDVDLYVFERLAAEGAQALAAGDAAGASALLTRALDLWRGPALADVADHAAAATAAGAQAARLTAEQHRVDACLALGRPAEALPLAQRLVAAHPLNEPFRARHIRALRAVGRSADALAAYEETRALLADRLGADPGPELRSLHRELLTGEAPKGELLTGEVPTGKSLTRESLTGEDVRGAGGVGDEGGGGAGTGSRADAGGRGDVGASAADGGRTPFGSGPAGEGRAEAVGRAPAGGRAEVGARSAPASPAAPAASASAEDSGRAQAAGRTADGDRREDGGREENSTSAQESAPPGRGNLRSRLTSFVGREAEISAIRSDVERHRLVTLVGPGGAGKTRLAERAGAALAARWPDGVWIAELAPVDHPGGVPRAVLNAVGRSDTTVFAATATPAEPLERLLEHCAHRRMLLVLDNCEHVVGAAAELAEALLGLCPGVTVLATSREPLGVRGEALRPVEPLPPRSARRLFTERAAAARPGFDAEAEPDAVDEICRRLDGLPLAIELAAARLRLLTPGQIADRLDDRFRLLTAGSRTALPRQQTLRAVFDWSWDLLSAAERALLRRLSVFAGGCVLDAAEAVCADGREITEAEVLDLLAALVDKSLVVADGLQQPGEVRYRFLETVHDYVAEHAAAHPRELAAAGRAHTAYCRDLVERAEPRLRRADQLHWLARLEAERDNIESALGRVVDAGDEPAAQAMVMGLGWFWWLRNYRVESAIWISRVVALGELPDDEGDPVFWPRMDLRLLLFFVSSDQATAAELQTEEALALARRITDVYRRSGPQSARFPGLLWPFAGFHLDGTASPRATVDVMVANCRANGGDWELACSLMFRTHLAIDSPGGLAHAEDDWAELTALSERSGDRWLRAQVHAARAELGMARGRNEQAADDFGTSLRLCEELGARGEIPFLTARIAEVSIRRGDPATAEALLVRAEREADHYGIWDARTYICFLRGTVALHGEDIALARQLCAAARAEAELGTPPPMFAVMLGGLEAGVLAAEGDPVTGLGVVAEALRAGLRGECAEPLIASLAERGAQLLLDIAEFTVAATLLGIADALRGDLPRSVPEAAAARRSGQAARSALGAGAHRAALDAGGRLGPERAAVLLDQARDRAVSRN